MPAQKQQRSCEESDEYGAPLFSFAYAIGTICVICGEIRSPFRNNESIEFPLSTGGVMIDDECVNREYEWS
ncbi:hypothetical protein JXA80_09440 [bacterium]|nr:hypothetical protein [candidate division CSSED10-310 bacterium]